MICALVAPAGSCLEIAPEKTMSVARPRIFGPTTASPTPITPRAMPRIAYIFSGPMVRISRSAEGQKFFALCPGRSPRSALFSASISAASPASSPAGFAAAGFVDAGAAWAPSACPAPSARAAPSA
jgi:hypothetical protein